MRDPDGYFIKVDHYTEIENGANQDLAPVLQLKHFW
jgi:hypothetical protein